ncbi:uncharacterized protein LOC116170714 [Photinus pyralis]|uniref:uncharacterized protein LOC116170714 n=1 Tax=Photinus pyralis TaxID=7054 RepID=UPI0012675AA9|nr:uncharacterized protein LOC116170714 [Photinus pyralis]
MNLRKWNSNDVSLRKLMKREENVNAKKVLGILWYHNDDELAVDITSVLYEIDNKSITKRGVLQIVSKIYDPLGFMSPFLVRANKILLQEIWKLKVDWDSTTPDNITNEWLRWCFELKSLKHFSFTRCALEDRNSEVSLHIFADASPKAYGAVAYLRVVNENEVECNFIMSKGRVAPIDKKGDKSLTLPKLELTAAVCATRLQKFILENIDVKFHSCTLWTDSKITIYWIMGKADRWKPYVRSRVTEIKKNSVGVWRHCPGAENPADLLTRGVTSKGLMTSEVWKHGPNWLKFKPEEWPEEDIAIGSEASVLLVQGEEVIQNNEPIFKLERFSSLEKIFSITAYVKRYSHNLRNKKNKRTGSLKAQELKEAERYWIKVTQGQHFSSEIADLRRGKKIEPSSRVLTLSPFLDEDDIMRLGGRLQESSLPYQTKYPVVLPKTSFLTDKLISNSHVSTMHGGVNVTMVHIRKRFWILQCRQRVKSILSKCIICKRLRAKPGNEPFAPLPRSRVSSAEPFKVTGLDFAGPLYIINESRRQKAYIMLLTCAVVRAVHLEIVPNLTAESCINAFRRFISRRGVPDIIYSDNAKTFKRTALELKELYKIICTDKFQNFVTGRCIEWRFIVERAAWWGGFWERMVKTVKDALKLSLGKKSLDCDELQTIISEIEATVNMRPLTYLDDQPENLMFLTPAHFLLGSNECGFHINNNHPDIKRNQILQKWKNRNKLTQKFGRFGQITICNNHDCSINQLSSSSLRRRSWRMWLAT